MKQNRCLKYLLITVILILSILTLFSCGGFNEEMDNHKELSKEFIDSILYDDYDSAYKLLSETVSEEEFMPFWDTVRESAEDATGYESIFSGFKMNINDGITTYRSSYEIRFDNGHTLLLTLITTNDIGGIAGANCSDATEFINKTEKILPPLRIGFIVLSVIAIAFTLWMVIDCLSRKMRRKLLWVIVILIGIAVGITVGNTKETGFHITLMLRFSEISANIWTSSISVDVVLPIGAIIYCIFRKKLTTKPEEAYYVEIPEEKIDTDTQ